MITSARVQTANSWHKLRLVIRSRNQIN